MKGEDAGDEGGEQDEDVKMEGFTPHIGGMVQSPSAFGMSIEDDDEDLFGPEPPRKRPRKDSKRARKAAAPARPVNVQDLFPSFEPGKILNFTDLFKGRSLKKSKVKHRPFNGEPVGTTRQSIL